MYRCEEEADKIARWTPIIWSAVATGNYSIFMSNGPLSALSIFAAMEAVFTRWTSVPIKLSGTWFEHVRTCHGPVQISLVDTHALQRIDNLAVNQNHVWTVKKAKHAQVLFLKMLIQQS